MMQYVNPTREASSMWIAALYSADGATSTHNLLLRDKLIGKGVVAYGSHL